MLADLEQHRRNVDFCGSDGRFQTGQRLLVETSPMLPGLMLERHVDGPRDVFESDGDHGIIHITTIMVVNNLLAIPIDTQDRLPPKSDGKLLTGC